MNKSQIIEKFLDAVNTWKIYMAALKIANKRNDSRLKSLFGKAVFMWRKKAESFKAEVDKLLGRA